MSSSLIIARLALVLVAAGSVLAAEGADRPPSVALRAGDLALTVWITDPEIGYYRGQRFDHGGMVEQATWRGHTFFGELKRPHDPTRHDHGSGTAEEFGFEIIPTYDLAQPGQGFLKIGVGILERIDAKPYAWSRAYPVLDLPTWTVTSTPTAVDCLQELRFGDIAYRFRKQTAVTEDGNGFLIVHELANTGTVAIRTDHYGHNMIRIDGKPLGPDYTLTFPVEVTPHEVRKGIVFSGKTATFTEEAATRTSWTKLEGLPADPSANAVTVAHTGSGVAVHLATDVAPVRGVIYAEKDTVCPEYFLDLTIEAGTTRTWTTTYRFSESSP